MLNDSMLFQSNAATACDDRRRGDRVPFPSELVLLWHHDPGTTIRYRVLDVSDGPQGGGMRIRSSFALTEGTTGTALRLLPNGEHVDRSIMVCWSRPAEEEGWHDVGLRFF